MATITTAWSLDWMSDATIGNQIDDKVDELAQAIDEREENLGRYWPQSSSPLCGLLYLGDNNYVANEFAVYDKDASNAPDTTDKVLRLTTSIFEVGNAGTPIPIVAHDLVKYTKSKTLIVEAPGASENITFIEFKDAVTISRVRVVTKGTSPSVTYNLYHSTDRSSTSPSKVWTSDQTVSNTTTGDTITTFDDPTIPAGSWLWFITSAVSGSVDEITIQVFYKED